MSRKEYARERAIAIRQYRFLMRVEKQARMQHNYYYAAKYRNEALQLKSAYNL